ncbi:MAG: hypothetical protein MJ112_05465, partial [Lachnospiraceae bacterium]|nr:hypothetical protein [Lachnospiraceae bacterium]
MKRYAIFVLIFILNCFLVSCSLNTDSREEKTNLVDTSQANDDLVVTTELNNNSESSLELDDGVKLESDIEEKRIISLGTKWSYETSEFIGQEIGESYYIGETFVDDSIMYKWWHHQYQDLEIMTSNIYWDIDDERTFDSYIIAGIITESANYDLGIGVFVGDSIQEVINLLGDDYTIKDDMYMFLF